MFWTFEEAATGARWEEVFESFYTSRGEPIYTGTSSFFTMYRTRKMYNSPTRLSFVLFFFLFVLFYIYIYTYIAQRTISTMTSRKNRIFCQSGFIFVSTWLLGGRGDKITANCIIVPRDFAGALRANDSDERPDFPFDSERVAIFFSRRREIDR